MLFPGDHKKWKEIRESVWKFGCKKYFVQQEEKNEK
jgi:hypothetical protein